MARTRKAGPDSDSAATTSPSAWRRGAATPFRPSSSSSTVIAYPLARVSSRWSLSAPTSVIVRGVSRSSGRTSMRSRSPSEAKARSTFPLAEQCSGLRRPTQLTLTIDRAPATWST